MLKKARGDRTQAEFARHLGLKNQATYQRYENGERIPNGIVLNQMASILGLTAAELLGADSRPGRSAMVREPRLSYAPVNTDLVGATTADLNDAMISLSAQAKEAKGIHRALLLKSLRAVVEEIEKRGEAK